MRADEYAESTISGALVVLQGIYRLARSRRLVSRSPVDELDPSERPRPRSNGAGRVLDEAQLALLARHASDRYRPVVTVLCFSGLRLSEALGLRWRDVDFVESELYVGGQLSRARGLVRRVARLKSEASERFVSIFPAVERALATLRNEEEQAGRGADDDLVFVTRSGRPILQRNAARAVAVAAEAAKLGKVSPQDLRRSFCSLAGRRNVDPVEAGQMTGHSLDARSFGKAQRDEARERLLEHGFGAVERAREGDPQS
jgi:integrase